MTSHGSQGQQTPSTSHPTTPTPASYSYNPYTPMTGYGQMSSAYPSPYPTTPSYQTGVSGYGAWPYQYSYLPQQHSASALQTVRPNAALPSTSSTFTSTFVPTAPQRPTTFSPYTPAPLKDAASTTPTAAPARASRKQQSNFKGLFSKELKSLMYGFGDDRNPANDTVNVMEEILIEYLTDVCSEAGSATRKSRLSIEDLRRALSRPADAKKLARMEELLFMQEDIKRARAQFEDSDINHTRAF